MAGRERVVVAGAGVGGLATALALGRAGHHVTLVERDPLPAAGDPEQAFATARRGAPQAHQTHGFLARIVALLGERFPDVLAALRDAGCTVLPLALHLGEPQPGDDDLVVLATRRTTFEWVLRRAVEAEAGVEVRTGVGVAGLTVAATRPGGPPGSPAGAPGPPRIDGVRLADGTRLAAGMVVAASGARSPVPAWLAAAGVEVDQTVHASGLMYLTRWYRLPRGGGVVEPKLGGDLGYVKYLGVPGDGGTLSVTLAVRSDDAEMRAALSDPDRFERACRALPGPDQFFARGPLEPVGGVRPMGGLVNRLRRFVRDGSPCVLGFHAVGDAHTCTNPLYGRGCTLALVQAVLLADAAAAHPGDPQARARDYEAACAREVEPWFHLAVQTDALGADPSGPGTAGARRGGRSRRAGPQARAMAALFAAGGTDPVIGRALARLWNLLDTPADLAARPDVVARMAAVVADPDTYPPPAPAGPTRRELLDALGASEEAAARA